MARENNRSKKMTWRDSKAMAGGGSAGGNFVDAVAGWRGSVEISKKGKEK
jgi:hypothetical protein